MNGATTTAPGELPPEVCSGCGAKIVWLRTQKGKTMPVNAEGVAKSDKIYDHTKHVSHFATCPQAKRFRK